MRTIQADQQFHEFLVMTLEREPDRSMPQRAIYRAAWHDKTLNVDKRHFGPDTCNMMVHCAITEEIRRGTVERIRTPAPIIRLR